MLRTVHEKKEFLPDPLALSSEDGARWEHGGETLHFIGKGSSRKNRPCQDDCYGKNSLNIVDSGARYKVYGPTHTSDRLTGHRWLTRVTRNSPRPLSPDEALLGARADRAVARCTRPLQHRIDHGTSVVQCRGAWEEWHHAPAWPSVAIAM